MLDIKKRQKQQSLINKNNKIDIKVRNLSQK